MAGRFHQVEAPRFIFGLVFGIEEIDGEAIGAFQLRGIYFCSFGGGPEKAGVAAD
jgi:hypothetical protein